MATLKDIQDSVRAERTIIAGLAALIGGLRQQVKDALGKSELSAEEQTKIDEIFAEAEANRASLANAVTENTAAEAGPAPQTGPGGTLVAPGGTGAAPAVAQSVTSSTVVDDAVAQAAQKATMALGEVHEAVTSGGDVKAAIEELKTAHAELAGVNDADTSAAEDKLAAAVEKLQAAVESDKPAVEPAAVLPEVAAAHNELIEAASAPAEVKSADLEPKEPAPGSAFPG